MFSFTGKEGAHMRLRSFGIFRARLKEGQGACKEIKTGASVDRLPGFQSWPFHVPLCVT